MRFIILSLAMLSVFSANSQQVISSAGNTKTVKSGGTDITVSWTIGEGVVATFESSNKTLTQGFHQPLMVEIFPTAIEGSQLLDMVAYPNPTYDRILFKGGDPDGIYHIRLVDKLGRVLEQKSVPAVDLEVEMSKYNNGTYLIEVVEDNTEKRRIFNIIKTSE